MTPLEPFADCPRALESDEALESVKAQLLLLSHVLVDNDVVHELAELSASRSHDLVDPPR